MVITINWAMVFSYDFRFSTIVKAACSELFSPSPLYPEPEYSDFVSTEGDAQVLEGASFSELDVVRTENNKAQLVTIGRCQRFKNWFFSLLGYPDPRMNRINKYLELVYRKPLELDVGRQLKFYRRLKESGGATVKYGRLSEEILKKLSPDLVDARASYENAKRNPRALTSLQMREFEWMLTVEEESLAEKLGIAPLKAGGGVNCKYIGRGLDERNLVIINTKHPSEIHRIFDEHIIGQRTQPEICCNDPREAGAAATHASERFGFHIVPPTFTNEKNHGIQLFIPDSIAADKAKFDGKLLKDRPLETFSEKELEMLQKKALFNYLVGELDGKDDKLRLVVKDGRIEAVYETDNDNTFPKHHLSTKTDGWTLRKTHAWKNHLWARTPLLETPGIDAILRKITNPKELNLFIIEMQTNYPSLCNPEWGRLLKWRVNVIKAVQMHGLPLSVLGAVYGPEALTPQVGEYVATMEGYFDEPFLTRPRRESIQDHVGQLLEQEESEERKYNDAGRYVPPLQSTYMVEPEHSPSVTSASDGVDRAQTPSSSKSASGGFVDSGVGLLSRGVSLVGWGLGLGLNGLKSAAEGAVVAALDRFAPGD